MNRKIKIAIIACEPSGDLLGEALILNLKKYLNLELEIFGVTGPKMEAQGCQSILDISQISVMGIFEIIRKLPELFKLRNSVVATILKRKPDLTICIDAPDFNLGLQSKIKATNPDLKIIHYISPTIWAWRKNRIYKIKRNVDHMLCLFPFEVAIYSKAKVNASYVGHPLIKKLEPIEYQAKVNLRQNFFKENPLWYNAKLPDVVAFLPGSRNSEITKVLPVFIKFLKTYELRLKHKIFVIGAYNTKIKDRIQHELIKLIANSKYQGANFVVLDSAEVALKLADVAICTSGTVTLEAALITTPTLVVFKTGWFTYFIARLLISTKYIALPNVFAGEGIVPELIQHKLTAENIYLYINKILKDNNYRETMQSKLNNLQKELNSHSVADINKIIIDNLDLKEQACT